MIALKNQVKTSQLEIGSVSSKFIRCSGAVGIIPVFTLSHFSSNIWRSLSTAEWNTLLVFYSVHVFLLKSIDSSIYRP